ncbi:DUF4124 domain-containing protein [Pseudothauera nasutitermitis]|nr:DUF4124 domain-containing protein [Pseudothauera nasutitermitis]
MQCPKCAYVRQPAGTAMKTCVRILFAFLLVLALATGQAQVYKCTENGKAVFSDKPCSSGVAPVDVVPATGKSPEERYRLRQQVTREVPAKDTAEERAERLRRLEEERNARWAARDAEIEAQAERRRAELEREAEELLRECGLPRRVEIRVGMDEQFVRACTDTPEPQSVNLTTMAGGTRAQWIMGGQKGYQYIYFDNGVVSAIQH